MKGDRFEVLFDTDENVLTSWRAPFTGGNKMRVPAGTILVADDQVEGAAGFACVPEARAEMEQILVPESDRTAEKYGGYYLVMRTADIGTKLRKLGARRVSGADQ